MERTLEFPEAEPFFRRTWRAQRIGWVVMLLVVVAALRGAFGHGPLAAGHTGTTDGVRVTWDRIARHQAPTELSVHFDEQAVRGGKAQLALSTRLIQSVDLQFITPEPSAEMVHGMDVVYTFNISRPPAEVRFSLKPDRMGMLRGTVGLLNGERQHVVFLVLP